MKGLKAKLNLVLKFFPQWFCLLVKLSFNTILLTQATCQTMKLKEIELIIQTAIKFCMFLQVNRKPQ